MNYDNDESSKKYKSLVEAVQHISFNSHCFDEASASSIIDSFATITSPEKEVFLPEFITIHNSRRPRGRSRKPGNVLLNWRKLLDDVPELALVILGTSTLPIWAVPLAGLAIWNRILRGTTEEFSPNEAVIMLALWKYRDANNSISETDAFEMANELLTKSSLSTIHLTDFAVCIDRLIGIRCLQLDSGEIKLIERIKVTY